MYVLKFKHKKSTEPCYSNGITTQQIKDIRDEDSNHHMSHYLLTLKKAKQLMLDLIVQNNNPSSWFDEDEELEYISIVEVSNYDTYREYEVVDYKEFK